MPFKSNYTTLPEERCMTEIENEVSNRAQPWLNGTVCVGATLSNFLRVSCVVKSE